MGEATDELRALIGEVSLNLAEVEEGVDWILVDLLVHAMLGSVDLDGYRQLASNTSLLTGPAFDALFESIFHVEQEDDAEIDKEPTEED